MVIYIFQIFIMESRCLFMSIKKITFGRHFLFWFWHVVLISLAQTNCKYWTCMRKWAGIYRRIWTVMMFEVSLFSLVKRVTRYVFIYAATVKHSLCMGKGHLSTCSAGYGRDMCHRNLVTAVPADGLAPNGARSSAGTVLTTQNYTLTKEFSDYWTIWNKIA